MKAELKFADVAPTVEAASLVGETVDNFRHHARSDAKFPVPMRIGGALFYRRKDLARWQRARETSRKSK